MANSERPFGKAAMARRRAALWGDHQFGGRPGVVSGQVLAELLDVHPFCVRNLFDAASLGKVKTLIGHVRVYELDKVAAMISEKSGFEVSPEMFPTLIKRPEAVALLASLGHPQKSWGYWMATGRGPRRVRIGGSIRYMPHDVYAWADELSRQREAKAEAAADRAGDRAAALLMNANGPNAAAPFPKGSGGGSFQFSPSEVGGA